MKRRTRRWGRILFNTLTAISLLLALATAGLWVRSTRYVDRYALKHTSAETLSVWAYTQGFGSLNLMKYTYTSAEPKLREGFAPDAGYSNESIHRFPLVERLFPPVTGFEFIDKSDQAPRMVTRFQSIEVPHWFVLLACSVPPAARGIAAIRRRFRDSPGHCPACGYDTRANPAKCSECGQQIATGGT